MKIATDTIIRTVVLVFALINQVLTSTGKNPLPFSNEDFYEIITTIVTVGAAIWAWWKNNSFTPEAIEADAQMRLKKSTK